MVEPDRLLSPLDSRRWCTAVTIWLRQSGVLEAALRPGELVPDVTLPRAGGGFVALDRLLDRSTVAALFVLGAGSRRCRAQLRAWQTMLPALTAVDIATIAIAPDRPEHACRLVADLALGFDVLIDQPLAAARLFGLAYQPPRPGDEWARLLGMVGGWSLPAAMLLPAAYLIDQHGIARAACVSADPTWRAHPTDLVPAI